MKRKREKASLTETMRGWFAQPAAEFYTRSAVPLYGGGLTEVQGCRAVLEMERDHVLLRLARRRVCLVGDGLVLLSLSGRAVLLRGTVFKVEFLEEDKA